MISKIDKNEKRKARHDRMRYYIAGTAEKPRLNVYRSLNNIYAQIIDDTANNGNGHTLVSASTLDKEIAAQIGALAKGIKKVVFDRGGYLYTGRVAAVADGAREAGLEI